MSFANKEEALEYITELSLDGKYPSNEEVMAFRAAGVIYEDVYRILSGVFYDGKELEDAESE